MKNKEIVRCYRSKKLRRKTLRQRQRSRYPSLSPTPLTPYVATCPCMSCQRPQNMIPLPPDQCPFGNFSLSLQCQAQHADRFIQDCRIRQVVVSQCSFEKKQEAEQFEISCSQCKDDTDLKSWFTFRYFLTGSLHGVIHKHHLRPLRGELNTAAAAYGTQVYPDEF